MEELIINRTETTEDDLYETMIAGGTLFRESEAEKGEENKGQIVAIRRACSDNLG